MSDDSKEAHLIMSLYFCVRAWRNASRDYILSLDEYENARPLFDILSRSLSRTRPTRNSIWRIASASQQSTRASEFHKINQSAGDRNTHKQDQSPAESVIGF